MPYFQIVLFQQISHQVYYSKTHLRQKINDWQHRQDTRNRIGLDHPVRIVYTAHISVCAGVYVYTCARTCVCFKTNIQYGHRIRPSLASK